MPWPKGKRRDHARRKPPEGGPHGEEAVLPPEGEAVQRLSDDVLMERDGVRTEVNPNSVAVMAELGWAVIKT